MAELTVFGTEGYQQNINRFVEISQSLDFQEVCKDFINFLPGKNAHVLDLGAGVGQNAAALDKLGFNVTAIEPIQDFVDVAQKTYTNTSVNWLCDSLPDMHCLEDKRIKFEFILIEGVWHHLDETERTKAANRLSTLISKHGKCAISLRNGPPGLGTKVYPTDPDKTVTLFMNHGFSCLFKIQNQPSILANKEQVSWARVVFEKTR